MSKNTPFKKGQTVCDNCQKSFDSHRGLVAHGRPETCKKRLERGWKLLTCQNSKCNKKYSRFVGTNGNRKGQKYCSNKCSAESKFGDDRNLSYSKEDEVQKVCSICSETFLKKRLSQKFCSRVCSSKNAYLQSSGYKVKDSSKMGGLREKGGRGKQFPYFNKSGEKMSLNIEEIEVAKLLDSSSYAWQRNTRGFPYKDEHGKLRKFYPDFYISDLDLYLEYKGWVTEKMIHKMQSAIEENDFNLKVVYGVSRRYCDMGTNIEQLQENLSYLKDDWNTVTQV